MATRQCLAAVAMVACAAAALGGCTDLLTEGTAAGAGIAGAAAAHAVTNNAGVTTGIGLGVQAAAHAGLEYTERRVHETEQNEIAAVANYVTARFGAAPSRITARQVAQIRDEAFQ